MNEQTLAEAVELERVYHEKLLKPFPYADCRHVMAQVGEFDEGLIPDLDLYFSNVAGYCSWGKRLQRMPRPELLAARATLTRSFFEKHPEYLPLTALINEADTPTLFGDLKLHEELRNRLLAIIPALLAETEAADSLPIAAAAQTRVATHYAPQRKVA